MQFKKLFIRTLLHWATFTIIVSGVLININPFNMDDVTSYASRDVFYRIWGVAYPAEKSPKAAVVIMREESLTDTESWPVEYGKHAAMLGSLMGYSPKAVFFDVAFFDNREDETIASLMHMFKKYHKKDIPVYIAIADMETGAKRQVRPDLQELADNGIINLVSILKGQAYGEMVSYRMHDTKSGHTPASFKMYQDLCSDIKGRGCAIIPHRKDELEVWWALPPSPFNCSGKEYNNLCEQISSSTFIRLFKLFFKGLFPFLDIKESDPVPTAYHPTIYWEDLMNGALRDTITKSGVLNDAVIFYGLDFSLINDDIFNPIYSQSEQSYSDDNNGIKNRNIPGVYFHAMAFDNLIALEDQVITPNPIWNMNEELHTYLVVVITVLVGVFFQFIAGLFQIHKINENILFYVFLSSIPLAIAAIEFGLGGSSPSNWIGSITVVNVSCLLQSKYANFKLFRRLRREIN